MNNGTKRSALGPSLSSAADDHLQGRRAHVRAEGEAEEDEHVAAAEVLVRDALAGMVGEREGAADQRLPHHLDAGRRQQPRARLGEHGQRRHGADDKPGEYDKH